MSFIYICPNCEKKYRVYQDNKHDITNLVCFKCGEVFMANETTEPKGDK